MATQRLVNTNFWKDAYIIDLDPTQKLLFLYFLTNPYTTLAGVYEINMREVAFDTGIDRDMVEKILAKFCADGKMHYERGWLILRNFVKHQRMNPSIQKGIEKAIGELPQWLQDVVADHSAIFDQQRLELADTPQSDTDTPQSEPIEAKLSKSKRNINKTITTYTAAPDASTKSAQVITADPIAKLYYEAIKSLGLPTPNHNTIRTKIAAMKAEATEQELINYLTFMRDEFATVEFDFKPSINTAFDIYMKRKQVVGNFERAVNEQQQTRVWRPKAA